MKKIKAGDKVQVMIGVDKGKSGVVEKVIRGDNGNDKVIVKGINIVKRSVKPNPQFGIEGGITEFEKPIHISNVMLLDGKKPARVGFKKDKNNSYIRISKKTNKAIE